MKNLNEDLQMRSDWLIPLCTGQERLKSDGRKAHPTQKPEALLHRVIMASTDVGDLVLDPFFGSGTTGAVAKRLGRRYVGIEKDETYRALAEQRLAAIPAASDRSLCNVRSKRDEPRIPFGWIVERGLLAPGTILRDQHGRFSARVAADGTVATADFRGSIHKAGAHVTKATACNGWQFWWAEEKSGKLVPLDYYRQRLRAELH